MSPVPSAFQRVINPWQTPREIARAVKFIEAMIKASKLDVHALLRLNDPPRDWRRPS